MSTPLERTHDILLNRYNEHDLSWHDTYVADDAVYVTPGGGVIRGRAQGRKLLETLNTCFPDERNELIHEAGNDRTAFLSIWNSGTFLGDMGPVKATGRSFRTRCVVEVTWQDDKIVEWVDHMDNFVWFEVQLGTKVPQGKWWEDAA
ncbi:ester cyclase [Nocardioides sp.]|uniref:ester cyclase n=1 Tax=Nocardioides sp. TaxID=35761 RepID=UPI0039E3CB76